MRYWRAKVDCWFEHPKTLKRGKVRRYFIVAAETDQECSMQAEAEAKKFLMNTQSRRFVGVEFREAGTIQLPYQITGEKID